MTKSDELVSELCKRSLEEKWYLDSEHELVEMCPFCEECGFNCSNCLCPHEICENGARGGYIAELIEVYGDNKIINAIDTDCLLYMRSLFKKYV